MGCDDDNSSAEERGNLWTMVASESVEDESSESTEFSAERARKASVDEEKLRERLKPFDKDLSRETLEKSLD